MQIERGRPDETNAVVRLRPDPSASGVAHRIRPLLDRIFAGQVPVGFDFWDGTHAGPTDATDVVVVRSPNALRRLIWAPGEVGLARAYVAGELDIRGDVFAVLRALRDSLAAERIGGSDALAFARVAARVGATIGPLPPPTEEARPSGRRHSKRRDARVVSHHYDVGNEFYRLVLGPSMLYSCARFTTAEMSLERAQTSKLDLICRKLGLAGDGPKRLLDVGCGWGSMVIHAANRYGATAVGITISEAQATLARLRVKEAGLDGRVEIRLMDYRDLAGERFDAISSIGMFEHVGAARMAEYFTTLRGLLVPHGRLLNHAISSVGGSTVSPKSFIGRYVFPDSELIDVADVVAAMQSAGFEVRDVESLREHYSRTLRQWVANLERSWPECVRLAGTGRARVWRLYMAACALAFDDGAISLHQVLGVVTDGRGSARMPATRRGWN